MQNISSKTRNKFFIAGTDTGVGKTCVASALLCAAKKHGLTTLGLKPVAAGGELNSGDNKSVTESNISYLQNEDALELMKHSTMQLSYEQVNPICLAEAIAPHIAAERESKQLKVDRIAGFCRGALMNRADFVVVEGAGGWRVPLNRRESMADLALALNMPVILVVGMRLGCLNHAILSAEMIRRDGGALAGWIGVQLEPDMPVYEENVRSLAEHLNAVHLGQISHTKSLSVELVAEQLDISKILENVRT